MIYIEHTPAPPLDRSIRSLWYAQAPLIAHHRQRVLPTGRVQIILNLARDFLLDCPASASAGAPVGELARRTPPSQIIGARSRFEIIDSSDLADLIGIVFQPGGFAPFAGDAVDQFSNRSVSLDELWGNAAVSLRDRLRELPGPLARLRCLERFLYDRFTAAQSSQPLTRHKLVDYALHAFEAAPSALMVREVARSTGLSERRFSQVFREQVGLSPKVYARLQRFQKAVLQLHAGVEVPWAEMALDCGYYDQAHFANEFRAFSGIDATTYSASRTLWANHVPVD